MKPTVPRWGDENFNSTITLHGPLILQLVYSEARTPAHGCVLAMQKATLVTGAAEAGAYVGTAWGPVPPAVGEALGETLGEVFDVDVGVGVTWAVELPGRVAR